MGDAKPLRIYSTLDGEPELQEPIEQFMVALAERVDLLQDAQLLGDLVTLGKLCGELRDDAQRFGYPQLADLANALLEACREDRHEPTLGLLLELTEIGRAIRRGHRGAF